MDLAPWKACFLGTRPRASYQCLPTGNSKKNHFRPNCKLLQAAELSRSLIMADSNNRKAAPDDTETLISDAAVLSAGVGDRGANESDRMQRPQPSVFAGLGTQIHRHHKSRRRVRRMHSQEADLMDVAMTDDASIGSQSLVSFLSRTDCGLERLSEDDAVASIASVSTAATAAGLPALPPYPEVTARSTRILSPPRPVTGRRPRGAVLLAWRRGQSSSRSSAASSVAHGSERLRDSLHTVKMRSGKLAGSDSEDGSHDGSAARRVELSDQSGSPLKDTYSFIYIYPLLSAPVLYAFLLCSFQASSLTNFLNFSWVSICVDMTLFLSGARLCPPPG